MIVETDTAVRSDFITALRIIYHEGLSDAFAHLSARSQDGSEMLFMPRKSPALVQHNDLFFVDFEKAVPQSALHQAIYKARNDVKAILHFHSPAVVLLSVVGQNIRPMHNYSAIFYQGVPLYTGSIGLNQNLSIQRAGFPVSAFYGFVTNVIFQSQEEVDRLIDQLRRANLSILNLARRRATLEDAFLGIVQASAAAPD